MRAQASQHEQAATELKQHMAQILHAAEAAHHESREALLHAKQQHRRREEAAAREVTRLTNELTACRHEVGCVGSTEKFT